MTELRRDLSGEAVVSRLRLALLVVTVFILHVALLSHITFLGAHPETLLLLSIVSGLDLGSDAGVRVGLLSGLFADVLTDLPIGMWALLCALLGYAVGYVRDRAFAGARDSLPPALIVLATAAGMTAYALLAFVLSGHALPRPTRFASIVASAAIMNVVLSVPMRFVVTRVVRLGEDT